MYYLMDIADRILLMEDGHIKENHAVSDFRKKNLQMNYILWDLELYNQRILAKRKV